LSLLLLRSFVQINVGILSGRVSMCGREKRQRGGRRQARSFLVFKINTQKPDGERGNVHVEKGGEKRKKLKKTTKTTTVTNIKQVT